MITCPNCGEQNPERFRVCGYCATPLAPALPPQEERRVVTVVFSDLKGSTAIGERLDPESLREVMTRYFDAMTSVLRRHGGTIEKFIGDAIMAVFGLPRLHEDDALRAVRAAVEMQTALAQLNEELDLAYGVRLANRTGVNTGEVVTGDATTAQRLVTGDTVNVAARLEQAAPAMEVLIGDTTYRLVRDAVVVEPVEPLELKGKTERVPAYRVLSAAGVADRTAERASPLVGREAEQAALEVILDRVSANRRPLLVTVIGEPGLGKTRLVHDFVIEVAVNARVVRGRCLSYGDGITFWPLMEVLRGAAGFGEEEPRAVALDRIRSLVSDPAVADRLATAVGLSDEPAPLTEIFHAARRVLEELAADQPLVVVIDDIHWAEATFLDLLEHLVRTIEAPVLILCTARPELEELRAGWPAAERAERLTLEPLPAPDAARLVTALLGDANVPRLVLDRIVTAAEGNPLFVEQLLAMLLDTGAVRLEGDRWVVQATLDDVAVPPTVHALLAARLDVLPVEDRRILEPASVVGLEFPTEAVAALAPSPLAPRVPVRLDALASRRLVRTGTSRVIGLEGYRFQHIFVRDAVYAQLLKRARAKLHEAFVNWVDQINISRGRVTEYEEINGYHLEQAYRYLLDLGPLDDHGRAVGRRAAEKLASAGRRAFGRGDMPAAATLLRRASETIERENPVRLALLPDLAEALTETGDFAGAFAVLDDAADAARAAGLPVVEADAAVTRLIVERFAPGKGWAERIADETARAIPLFEREGNERGLAKAWRLIGFQHGHAGRHADAAAAAERVMQHARAANDPTFEARGAITYAMGALRGPTPVPEALSRCREIAAQIEGDRRTNSMVLLCLAELEAMAGDVPEARLLYRRAREQLLELGGGVLAESTSLNTWRVEMLAGDPARAEQELRRDAAALEAMGERYLLSTILAALAHAVVAQGRADEAESLTETAEALTESDDVLSQMLWRSARGRVRSSQGRHEEAVALSREAVEFAGGTDAPVLRAQVLIDLADALVAAGEHDRARPLLEEAEALSTGKGDLVTQARVRERLVQLAAPGAPVRD